MSETTKQTPGPWTSEGTDGKAIHSHGADGKMIATVWGTDGDARLIAAAPELVEAFRALVAACQREGYVGIAGRDAVRVLARLDP